MSTNSMRWLWKYIILDHAITMTAMKYGLQLYPFLFFLEKRPVTNFSKMLARAKKYACAEEMYGACGPPSTPMALTTLVVKEQPPIQKFQPRKED